MPICLFALSIGAKINDLVDPELTLNGLYALCYIAHMSFGVHYKNVNEDRPITIIRNNVAQGS